MATEYGYRRPDGSDDEWADENGNMLSKAAATQIVLCFHGYSLIAREVSEPRIVSIRA